MDMGVHFAHVVEVSMRNSFLLLGKKQVEYIGSERAYWIGFTKKKDQSQQHIFNYLYFFGFIKKGVKVEARLEQFKPAPEKG